MAEGREPVWKPVEYKVIDVEPIMDPQVIQDLLNELGLEGWQLLFFRDGTYTKGQNEIRLYFMRSM